MLFQESGFSFEFPNSWTVVKFDDHRFYKYLSGDGFKGVDFLCLNEKGELIFLEVKNYLNQYIADGIDPGDNLIQYPENYALEYWNKYLDSIHLIRLIHKYYLRKWWYRQLIKIANPKVYHWAKQKDWGFWTSAFLKLESVELNQHFMLWLEIDLQNKNGAAKAIEIIRTTLEQKATGKNIIIRIFNSHQPGPMIAKLIN